jgi:hypothetical protein
VEELPSNRVKDIQVRIQSGLRQHVVPESKTPSIQLADRLAVIHDEIEDIGIVNLENVEDVGQVLGRIDTTTLNRLRKITEIVEDDLSVDIGHSKLTRAAMTGTNLTSIGAFIIAGHNLLISANMLDEAHARRGSVSKIKDRRFHDFYRATCVFIAEGFLLTTPINFRFAWRGTRYLNNRVLYRLRQFAPNLHRLILSEIHYVIRGIAPGALRSPDEFATFLTSMAVQTVELLSEFSEIKLTNLPQKVKEIIDEYQTFVDEMYDVITADLNLENVIQDVVDHLTGAINLPSIPSGQNIDLSR